MLASTVLVYSIGSLVCGLAPNLTVFMIGRAIVGLGVGGEWAIGHGLLAEAVSPQVRGRTSALLQAGEPVGVSALAAIAGFIIMPAIGWRWVLIGSSFSALLAWSCAARCTCPDTASRSTPLFSTLRRARIGGLMAARLAARRVQAGHLLDLLHLVAVVSVEADGAEHRSFADLGATAQNRPAAGYAQLWVRLRSLRSASCVLRLFAADGGGDRTARAYGWSYLSDRTRCYFGRVMFLVSASARVVMAGFGALLAELFPDEVRATAMGATYNLARAGSARCADPGRLRGRRIHGTSGGLTVPLCLAVLTACWVWALPETRGIELPELDESAGASPPELAYRTDYKTS